VTQALARKETTALAAADAQGTINEALKSDVLVPKVLLMQGLSDYVAERKAQQGDIVRSTTAEKLGDDKTPLEFIPLSINNSWIIKEKVGTKYEYRKSVPRKSVVNPLEQQAEATRIETDRQDENLPWEFKHNGTDWKRIKAINCFALLPRDIAAFQAEIKRAEKEGDMPDLEKTLMPVLISFSSYGFAAGRMIATHFTKAAAMAQYGAKPYGFALTLSCYLDKNDLGSFYVFTVGGSRKCSKEEFAEASKWAGIVSTQNVTIHEVEEGGSSAPSSDQF
jgi:hypothetical protein